MPDHLNLCKKRNKTYTTYKTYFSVIKNTLLFLKKLCALYGQTENTRPAENKDFYKYAAFFEKALSSLRSARANTPPAENNTFPKYSAFLEKG
jgi:hypothetical protein